MRIQLLGQGYEIMSKNSVGHQIIRFLDDTDFHTFTAISAFISQSGIKGLSKHIKSARKHLNHITIITGVDQKGTSKEALEELLALDVHAYIFYQTTVTIFHPKVYLFEGNEKSELIIGSSNLTSQGLFSNIEASLLISIDNNSEADREIVEQLKEYFKGIFDFSDPNMKNLDRNTIADLVKAKVVPTEEERKTTQEKTEITERKETESIISKIFPPRSVAKIPIEFRGVRKPRIRTISASNAIVDNIMPTEELVWESRKLTERDLNIPKGANTNPTGSMLFKKGKMQGIDHRHYFRDTVFASLIWNRETKPQYSHLERAVATFKIIIEGKTAGTNNLIITHN